MPGPHDVVAALLVAALGQETSVRPVPAGLAVATDQFDPWGDRLGFYVVSDPQTGLYRLEDAGCSIPLLMAEGREGVCDAVETGFVGILSDTVATFDPETSEIRSPWMDAAGTAQTAPDFVAALIRIFGLGVKPARAPERAGSIPG